MACSLPHSSTVGAAETEDLYAAINAYRQTLGLPAIPLSPQLTAVAQAHVQDLIANSTTDPNYTGAGCVPHSWSSQGAWTGGCYKYEDAASYPIMWDKPGEIAGYPGMGFEILYGANGATVTAAEALQAWQTDGPHNDVIVNQGVWQDINWQAIGVWVQDGWAAVWFGVAADPGATQPAAAQPADTTANAPQPDTGVAPPPPADPAGTTAQPEGGQEGQPADTAGTTTPPEAGQEGQPADTTGTTTQPEGGRTPRPRTRPPIPHRLKNHPRARLTMETLPRAQRMAMVPPSGHPRAPPPPPAATQRSSRSWG